MDFWAFILAAACLGTFILEVFAFWRIIRLIEEIKASLGIVEGYRFQPGDMLANGVISLMEKMGADNEEGERARKAFGSIVLYGSNIAMSSISDMFGKKGTKTVTREDGTTEEVALEPLEMLQNIDLSVIPRKHRDKVALAQMFLPVVQMLKKDKEKKVQGPNNPPGW